MKPDRVTGGNALASRNEHAMRGGKLWRYMQMVEKCRHLSDTLEKTAALGGAIDRPLAGEIAAQYRDMAEQCCALAFGADPPPVRRLRPASFRRQPLASEHGACARTAGSSGAPSSGRVSPKTA